MLNEILKQVQDDIKEEILKQVERDKLAHLRFQDDNMGGDVGPLNFANKVCSWGDGFSCEKNRVSITYR